jgi:hypothetical protein
MGTKEYLGQILSPWLGEIVTSDIGFTYLPASLCSLAGRYDIPMPESTIPIQSGTKFGYCTVEVQCIPCGWLQIKVRIGPCLNTNFNLSAYNVDLNSIHKGKKNVEKHTETHKFKLKLNMTIIWLTGRWVAKREMSGWEGIEWLRGKWVAKREMGGQVGRAPACCGSSGFESRHLSKYN